MQTNHYLKAIILTVVAITSNLSCYASNPESTLLKGTDGIYWNIDDFGTLHLETRTKNCPDFKVSPFIKYKDIIQNVVFEDNGWDSTLEIIGKNMFKGLDKIQTIKLPYTLKVIGANAFDGCTSLTELNVPESVEIIGQNVLRGCASLKSLSLPFLGADGSVWVNNSEKNYIGWIFGKSTGAYFYSVSQAIGAKNVLTCSLPVSLSHITVNGGYVYTDAFTNCESIKDVTLGDNVMAMPIDIAVGQYGDTKLFSQL